MSTGKPSFPAGQHIETIVIPFSIWESPGVHETMKAPLLLVHDGPEYDQRSRLTEFLAQQVQQKLIPPHRVALIEPIMGKRNEWYGANPKYEHTFTHRLIPTITETYPTQTRIVGMGASLGAISMLGIAYKNPGLLKGLFLQSGSYHHPNLDTENNSYDEYHRVASLVEHIVKSPAPDQALIIEMTCGVETNLLGNIVMAAALAKQGNNVSFNQTSDDHNFEAWRKAFAPSLTNLLQRVWLH